MTQVENAGPLAGIKVVELGVWVAGPAAGGVLADWGADVVKIEPPEGDPARGFAKMLGGDVPFNPPFEMDNRSKRSIVVDLGDDAGRGIARELLADADVFLTNIRMDALRRLDLDPETLRAANPKLVYGIITGYGLEGPDADRAAYDIGAFWARSGIAHLLDPPGGDGPPFQRGGQGDHNAGMTLAAGVCAALVARGRTGEGQLVHTSLLRHGMYTISFDLNTALRFGVSIGIATHETMTNPAINRYQDSDGRWFWLIGLDGERHWPDLCRSVDRAEWIDDERFATAAARDNVGVLIPLLDEQFATRTRDEWGEAFDREGMWWAPVQSPDEVLADPQAWAGGGFVEVPDGDSTVTMINSPVDFAGTPGAPTAMPPELGQHTDEVLAELGRDPAAIARLRADGVVA